MWFGGSTGPPSARPRGSIPLAPYLPQVWASSDWPEHERRVASHRGRHVVVLGPCGVDEEELVRVTGHTVPDDVVWRWPGSYVVAQIEPGTVTIWTDLSSAIPVYTRRTPEGVLWASSSHLLAGFDGAPVVNLDKVAARLVSPDTAEAGTDSFFHGVARVPPGHRLRLTVRREPDTRAMWRPTPMADGHALRLRSALEDAVAVRVDHSARPSTDFSGGFDSTALGLLAAERLAPEGRGIVGVTVHPEGVHHGGDLDYAREAAHHPGLDHRWMPVTDDHTPYGKLDLVPATDEPAPSTVSYAYFSGQLTWLTEEVGSDMHMTGDGGDALLLTPPYYLVELLNRARIRRALGEAARWAHVRRMSILEAFRTANSRAEPAPVPSWVGAKQPVAGGEDPFSLESPTLRALMRTMAQAGRTARSDVQIAEAFGIALHNPYFDSQVIDAYLSVPVDGLPGPARYKPIMAEAMRDLFPERLTRRTTKGDASSDHHHGLRKALPALLGFVDGHLAGEGLVDVAGLRGSMRRAAMGVGDELAQVESAVATEAWLRAVRSAPAIPWETIEVRAA
ncbi:albusnodin/ikarugamycin family macrolactam cyclase [Nocardiopsis quinghaiensis]|uniref:albusnodin/ikarugamycin family macrolactam cyclase n=1 Tax=Nocardiopsis quinghaiensis TaxID=464995 RepID=UPI001238D355|nr:albusnodin/ikarugamycin family macrolactam cyclase [Nocardiopsis quinghaiensis]